VLRAIYETCFVQTHVFLELCLLSISFNTALARGYMRQ